MGLTWKIHFPWLCGATKRRRGENEVDVQVYELQQISRWIVVVASGLLSLFVSSRFFSFMQSHWQEDTDRGVWFILWALSSSYLGLMYKGSTLLLRLWGGTCLLQITISSTRAKHLYDAVCEEIGLAAGEISRDMEAVSQYDAVVGKYLTNLKYWGRGKMQQCRLSLVDVATKRS